MRFKTFLIVLLMLSSVIAPVFDLVACDDCADPVSSQRGIEAFRQIPDVAGVAQHNDQTAADADAENLCPICANAGAGSDVVKCSAPCETLQTAGQPKLLAFSDPSYSINKPPQN